MHGSLQCLLPHLGMTHALRTIAIRLAALLLLAATTSLAAQSPSPSPLIGTWSINWEIGRRIMNGESGSIKAKGTMSIVPSGDSLMATITTLSREDGAPPPAPYSFGGRITASGARLVRISEAVMTINGEERKQPSTAVWTLSLDGQTLQGTIAREVPGLMGGTPTSMLTGTRAPR